MTDTATVPTTTAVASLGAVVLDCLDTAELARFYSAITGWPVGEPDEEWLDLVSPLGVTLSFQRADEYVPPQWPTTDPPQQFHLDFTVPDLDLGEQQVLALGATKAEHQPGTTFRVFLDPAGHPFCLCQS